MMKTWEVNKTVYKVSDFVSWQRSGSLELSPSYQRRPVWQAGAKSYLIDTVLRGLPIPVVFLRDIGVDLDDLTQKREVVDGQQRIRTLLSFIGGGNLTPHFNPDRDDFTVRRNHNKDVAGKRFKELDRSYQQRILDYQFSVHVFPQHVDDREILQIFARMNSTGVKLKNQELRNAHFYGELKTLMYELALEQLQRWRSWQLFTEDEIARMDEVELTSELTLLMLKGVSGRTKTVLDNMYREFDDSFPMKTEISRRFRYVMDSIDESMGVSVAESPFARRTLFYALFGAYYAVHYGIGSELVKTKAEPLPVNAVPALMSAATSIDQKLAPEPVMDAAARRTTHPISRRTLLSYLLQDIPGADLKS